MADAVQDKVEETKSELPKESNKNSGEHEAKGIVETVKEKAAEAYTYVAGGEDVKGLVETIKEKATEACHYVAEKVSEAAHAVTGDTHKEVGKNSDHSVDASANAAGDTVKDKVDEKTS